MSHNFWDMRCRECDEQLDEMPIMTHSYSLGCPLDKTVEGGI